MADPAAFEALDSRPFKMHQGGKGDALRLHYFVTGTNDEAAAYDALAAALFNAGILIDQIVYADSVDMKPLGVDSWEAWIEYKAPADQSSAEQPRAIGEATIEFDGTGGQAKIFEAYAQRKYGANAPDHGNRINVTENGVDGVEIVIPQLSFSVHQRFEGATITLPWLRSIVQLTGRTNAGQFFGFEAGEVLFLGPAGQQPFQFLSNGAVKSGDRDVTFRFSVSPNLSNLTVGDITGIVKKGHEYMWIAYETEADGTGNALTKTPVGVYVAETYQSGSFGNLALNENSRPVAGA